MGNLRSDRQLARWPGRTVPYEIDPIFGASSRTQITAAMQTWTAAADIQFVPHDNQDDFVVFERRNDECFSQIGRTGGRQTVGCEFPIDPTAQPGQLLSFANQGGSGQVDCVYIGTDGGLRVAFTVGTATWTDGVPISPAGVAPAGAPVALEHQGADQLDALFVDVNGAVNVMWVQGGGNWAGPVGVS